MREYVIYAGKYKDMMDEKPYAFVTDLMVIPEIEKLILYGKDIDYITIRFSGDSIHLDLGNLKCDYEDIMGFAYRGPNPYPNHYFEIRNPFYDEGKAWDIAEQELIAQGRAWDI